MEIMKKKYLFTILTAILTVIFCMLPLTACGGGDKTLENIKNEYGATIEGGSFPAGALLVTTPIAETSDEGKAALDAIKGQEYNVFKPIYIFDISVVKDNATVQPDGKVKVSIPVAANLVTYKAVLHIKGDDTVERLAATYADGKISFETDGFSVFVLVEPIISNMHVHAFSEEWSQSETHHWHACLSEKCDAKEDLAEHYYDVHGGWSVEKPATETETGLAVRVCIGCKYEDELVIPKYDPDHVHTYGEDWQSNEYYHWHVATCAHIYEAVGMAEHSWNDGVITTPATDEEDGVKTYTCTVCGATNQKAYAHEHTFSEDWSKDETHHWHAATCEHTAEVDGKVEHTWGTPFVERDSSHIDGGLSRYSCTICGKTKVVTTEHRHVYKDWYFAPAYHWQVANCSYSVCNGIRSPQSAHEYENGACKDCGIKDPSVASSGLEFTLQEDGTYFVSGIGTCTDVHLVIPSVNEGKAVTGIANGAFKGNRSLRSVHLPDGVKTVGDMAFQNCSSLNSVRLPEDMISIGESAFSYGNLHTLVLPTSGLNKIEKYAFQHNQNIINLYIPDNIKTIGEKAFYECTGVTELRLPETMTALGVQCFAGLNMTSVTIPNGITELPKGVFASCDGLTSVTVPVGIETIGDEAFSQCDNLETISLPEGLSSLGSMAFAYDKKLAAVTIPSTLTEIKNQAFYACDNLAEVNLPSTLTTIGQWAFAICPKLTAITLPSELTTIGTYAFSNTGLTAITIPVKLTEIGNYAFYQCKSLASITLHDDLRKIGDYTFAECIALKSISIPNGVTEILPGAFNYCTELASVNLPTSLTKISTDIFSGTKIKSITIPDSVTEIGWNAFSSNSVLETVTFGSQSKVKIIGNGAFGYCDNLVAITLPSSVEVIEQYAFAGCEKLTTVSVPSSIKDVKENAFYDSKKISYAEYGNACYLGNTENPYYVLIQVKDKTATSCEIHTSTAVIAECAFTGSAVTSISIPDSVKAICSGAFYKSKIETVTLASIDDWCYVYSEENKTYYTYSESASATYWNSSSSTDKTRASIIRNAGYIFRLGFLPSYTHAE